MSQEDVAYLELEDFEYAEPGPMIVEGPDGGYTILNDQDFVLPEPGKEDVEREINLDRLRCLAVNTAEKYLVARYQEKQKWEPLFVIISFFAGAWLVGGLWILSNNGYLGG